MSGVGDIQETVLPVFTPPTPTGGLPSQNADGMDEMVEPFALARPEVANSILKKKSRKNKLRFYNSREAFYLSLKNSSLYLWNTSLRADNNALAAENERLRSLISEGGKLTYFNIEEMESIKQVLRCLCTFSC